MEETPGSVTKRPRPVLSCLECRRKKLKCDRNLPCNQCLKISKPGECRFTVDSPSQPHPRPTSDGIAFPVPHGPADRPPPDRPIERPAERPAKRQRILPPGLDSTYQNPKKAGGVLEDLQARVKKLERLLGQEQVHSDALATRSSNLLTLGNTERTDLYGQNHRSTLLSPFDEAQHFLKNFPDDPVLQPYIDQVRQFQKNLAIRDCESGRRQDSRPRAPLPSLTDAVPSKEVCDELVHNYSQNAEMTLRILHIPTFLAQYRRYWESNQRSAPFGFVPQLLTVIAIATSPSKPHFRENSNTELPVPRDQLLEIVNRWLSSLKRKPRLTITAMQTSVLAMLSSHNIFLPNDKTWVATGSLVRYAMALELHRDPSHFRDVSVFEGEIRRRLWATILEIDLQTSLVFGMPTAIRDRDWDTAPPGNLDDSEISENMTWFPVSNSLDSYTSSLFQVILARSLPQRMRTATFINQLNINENEGERHAHGKAIEQLLRDIPSVAKAELYQQNNEDERPSAGGMLGRVLLDINIRRLLLYLYRPFAMRVSDAEIFFNARRICRDSALVVLSHQDTFEPHTTDLETADADEYWTLFETQCRHDVLLAALTICWEIKMMNSSRSLDPQSAAQQGEVTAHEAHYLATNQANPMPWTKARLTRIVDDALQALMQKLDKPGGFLKDVLGLAVVFQSVKTTASPERKEQAMRKSAVEVAQAFLDRVAPNGVEILEDTRPTPGMSNLRHQVATPAASMATSTDSPFNYTNGFSNGIEQLNNDLLRGIEQFDSFDFTSDWNLI